MPGARQPIPPPLPLPFRPLLPLVRVRHFRSRPTPSPFTTRYIYLTVTVLPRLSLASLKPLETITTPFFSSRPIRVTTHSNNQPERGWLKLTAPGARSSIGASVHPRLSHPDSSLTLEAAHIPVEGWVWYAVYGERKGEASAWCSPAIRGSVVSYCYLSWELLCIASWLRQQTQPMQSICFNVIPNTSNTYCIIF